MSRFIRQQDRVIVHAGNDRGSVGQVLSRQGERVIVRGVNRRKKHLKQRGPEQSARILEIECSIHISNVSLCDGDDRPIRLRCRYRADGTKELYYLQDGQEKLYRVFKKSRATE